MPTLTLETAHDLNIRLSAERVDAVAGIIYGATVAMAGVRALGKFVFIDSKGQVTRDEKLAVKKLPVFTDSKTLETLMLAAKSARSRVKTREDHDDSIGARAGFANAFKRVSDTSGDRVIADIHVFEEYRNRGVFLETADKTPDEIGLSIDFLPSFEIDGDRALMRIEKLTAVDIVDEGAITPGGLLLSARVDIARKCNTPQETSETLTMATPPTNEEIMSAMSALGKQVSDCMAAFAQFQKSATPADGGKMAAVEAENLRLATAQKELADTVKAVKEEQTRLKKERLLMGMRASDAEKTKLSAGTLEDIEKLAALPAKTYLAAVDEHVAKEKCKRSDAHLFVMKAQPELYREHLNAKGIRPATQNAA